MTQSSGFEVRQPLAHPSSATYESLIQIFLSSQGLSFQILALKTERLYINWVVTENLICVHHKKFKLQKDIYKHEESQSLSPQSDLQSPVTMPGNYVLISC